MFQNMSRVIYGKRGKNKIIADNGYTPYSTHMAYINSYTTIIRCQMTVSMWSSSCINDHKTNARCQQLNI